MIYFDKYYYDLITLFIQTFLASTAAFLPTLFCPALVQSRDGLADTQTAVSVRLTRGKEGKISFNSLRK